MLTHILNLNASLGNLTYVFLCTILVFLMTPGLALFMGDLNEKKFSNNYVKGIPFNWNCWASLDFRWI